MNILCFRHPEISTLERYYLPFPPNSIPGKCFVSLPRRQAAELARQQAEVLGVGRLVKRTQITEQEAPVEALPPQIKSAEEASLDAVLDNFSDQIMEGINAQAEEIVNVELPNNTPDTTETIDETTTEVISRVPDNVEIPLIEEPEEVSEMSDVEIEFRTLVTELIEAGVEPTEMMDDPRWEDISERAMATGFETWPVFLELTAVQ